MALTRIERDGEGPSETVSTFLIEFANIYLRDTEQEDRRIASQLVNLLTHSFFKTSIFKTYITLFPDSKDVRNRYIENLINENVSSGDLRRCGVAGSSGSGILYKNELTEKL